MFPLTLFSRSFLFLVFLSHITFVPLSQDSSPSPMVTVLVVSPVYFIIFGDPQFTSDPHRCVFNDETPPKPVSAETPHHPRVVWTSRNSPICSFFTLHIYTRVLQSISPLLIIDTFLTPFPLTKSRLLPKTIPTKSYTL